MSWHRISSHVALCVITAALIIISTGALIYKEERGANKPTIAECITDTADTLSVSGDCLNTAIGHLLETRSTRDILEYITSSTSPKIVRDDCHPITHVLGKKTFAKVGSVEESLLMCTDACNSGCIHGVIGAAVAQELGTTYSDKSIEHADAVAIKEIGSTYCKKSPSLCHAVGHILYISNRSLQISLVECTQIAESISKTNCYEGVFMQASSNFSSLFPDKNSGAPVAHSYGFPCNELSSSKYQHACFEYLPAFEMRLFLQNLIPLHDRTKIMQETCLSFSGTAEQECFFGFGLYHALERPQLAGKSASAEYCEKLPTFKQRESCSLGFAFRFANVSRYENGASYCKSIDEVPRRNSCYGILFQQHENEYSSSEPPTCAQSDSVCRAAYAVYLKNKKNLLVYRYGLEK